MSLDILIRMMVLAIATGFAVSTPNVTGDEVPETAKAFLENNCYDCHDGSSAEAGFDLAKLSTDYAKTDVSKWVRMFDRVHDKEMPPKDYGTLDREEKKQFEQTVKSWLDKNQTAEFKRLGRVRGRRLTNLQLERTLHDMLGIDIPLAALMPEEQRVGGFTSVADGQAMSHFQLENHLLVVDAALDEAFRRALQPKEDNWSRTLDSKALSRRNPNSRCREPEDINNHAVTWSARLVFYGRLPSTTARADGWYRIKAKVKALKPQIEDTVWCTIRTGKCTSGSPLLAWVDSFEAQKQTKEIVAEAWLGKEDMFEIRPGDIRLKRGTTRGGQVGRNEIGPQNVPGLAIENLVLERFHKNGDDKKVRELLFRELDVKLGPKPEQSKVKTSQPKIDAATLIHKFAHRAFRRRVEPDSVKLYVNIAHTLLDEGESFHDAVRAGYRAILCSPRFLYFNEKPGALDDFAIASRLSYFLWNRMPDLTLLRLADKKQLRDPNVLKTQIARMLSHAHGQSFLKDFAHDWLELRLIDFTEPDPKMYPGFDLIVQNSMVEETHKYLQTMLDKDLGTKLLIDSNFTFLNSRLAQYYEIDGVAGDELQRVKLKSDHHRGGLITHGSVLKITANGTTTSPVIRGVWISERILGEEIPPPPENIAAIEPDIRGAKTIRQQLLKHKNDPSCASCHIKMDPPGYALENYDPSGRWRDRYVKLKGKRRVPGTIIDASSKLPGGVRFKNVGEFQKLLLKDPTQIAENVFSKLVTYGTGAPIAFSDREEVAGRMEELEDKNFGLRSIVESVVLSNIFLTK